MEEAYLTTLSLPAACSSRPGSFYAPFGRINQPHPHTWEFLDAPLARRAAARQRDPGRPRRRPALAHAAPLVRRAAAGGADHRTRTPAGRSGSPAPPGCSSSSPSPSRHARGRPLGGAPRRGGRGLRDLGDVDLFLKFRPPAGRPTSPSRASLHPALRGDRPRALPAATAGAATPSASGGNDLGGGGVRYDRAPGPARRRALRRRRAALVGGGQLVPERVLPGPALQAALVRARGPAGWEWILHLEFVMGAHGAHPF